MVGIEFHPTTIALRDDGIKTWLDALIIVSFKLFGQRFIVDIIPDLGFGCIDIQIVDPCLKQYSLTFAPWGTLALIGSQSEIKSST